MQSTTTLRFIEKGQKVFDRERHEIGKVDYVQFGDDDPETLDTEAAAPNTLNVRDNSLIDNIADVFSPGDNIPDELQEKLLQQGFVRLDAAGLFASDRYITPEQIDSVSGDGVTLNVSKDELIKKH